MMVTTTNAGNNAQNSTPGSQFDSGPRPERHTYPLRINHLLQVIKAERHSYETPDSDADD